MKIVCFSDTHNKHKKVELPECDLAIFAGDMSSLGYKHEVGSFLSWFSKQDQCVDKVYIAGNHDRSFDPKFFREFEDYDLWKEEPGKPIWLQEMIEEYDSRGVKYLENDSINVEGVKIWGSPITPSFYKDHWAFNRDRNFDIQQYWDKIPQDTDIVVTHGPVYGKLDFIPESNEYVGCVDLKQTIETIKPKLFVCGHIHSGYGAMRTQDTVYVNAAVLDNWYDMHNPPIVINLDVDKMSVTFE